MKLFIKRIAYTPENVQGVFHTEDWSWGCEVIARPWIPDPDGHNGGAPSISCIPDGEYELIPYTRTTNGERCFAIVNPELGVYFKAADRPRIPQTGKRYGRFKTLVHGRANYVGDVEGCEAVGRDRMIDPDRNEQMVTSSGATMRELVDRVGWVYGHTLTIYQGDGALENNRGR